MKPRPSAFRSRTEISKSLLADVAGKGASSKLRNAHSFRRGWHVASAQKFHFFLLVSLVYSRDRGSEDAVVFPEI